MPLTPEDVSNKRFTPVRLREGYDMGEVDQFLDEVEAELARLTTENDELRAKLAAVQSGADAGETTQLSPVAAAPSAPEAPAYEPPAEPTPEPVEEAPAAPEPEPAPAPVAAPAVAPVAAAGSVEKAADETERRDDRRLLDLGRIKQPADE